MLLPSPLRRVILKSASEIETLAAAGRLASECLAWILRQVEPGMSTQDIDDLQVEFVRKHDVVAAPLHYRGFPKSICTSINEVICHGIPDPNRVLQNGDIIGIDVTLILDGFHGDNAATIPIGTPSEEALNLLKVALEANRRGVEAAGTATRVGDIGHAIQSYAEELGYGVVHQFVGHGIGRGFHEEPQIPHVGSPGKGPRVKPGMTFTVEPMINVGTAEAQILDDGWTAITTDGSLSAQFEHTMARTPEGVRVLTVQNDDGLWEPPGRWDPERGFF